MIVRFRPLPIWPYEPTTNRRSRWSFRAGWDNTLRLLNHEVEQLAGHDVVIAAGFREQDLRQDGWPRADAKPPAHPGIEVSFTGWVGFHNTKRVRLVYASDSYEFWQHNVRAIALGLEALRAVDRYGITRSGEQYAGFKALPPGGPSVERGAQLIRDHGGLRRALMATHPDHGGDSSQFADVQAAREAGVV